jgi:hypothetical protein
LDVTTQQREKLTYPEQAQDTGVWHLKPYPTMAFFMTLASDAFHPNTLLYVYILLH